MQARYYDPVIGRFYSNDPIGFRGVHSFSRYAYVNNNPYKFTDPTGMCEAGIGAGNYSCDYFDGDDGDSLGAEMEVWGVLAQDVEEQA